MEKIEAASQNMHKRILLWAGRISTTSDPHEGGVRPEVETVGDRRRAPAVTIDLHTRPVSSDTRINFQTRIGKLGYTRNW